MQVNITRQYTDIEKDLQKCWWTRDGNTDTNTLTVNVDLEVKTLIVNVDLEVKTLIVNVDLKTFNCSCSYRNINSKCRNINSKCRSINSKK